MSSVNKQIEDEMIEYIEHLLKTAIQCHGINTKYIAKHLVCSGCRIHIGPRRRKYMNINNNENK